MYGSELCVHLEVLLSAALTDLAGQKPHLAEQFWITTGVFNFCAAETH